MEFGMSKTAANLREAFAREAQDNRRYLFFAQKADVEVAPTLPRCSALSPKARPTAFGHLEYLKELGDPVTGEPIGSTADNLRSAVEGDSFERFDLYPRFAKEAREEGFEEIAEWLETVARAEGSRNALPKALPQSMNKALLAIRT